jgi:hypothetical protein
MQQAKQAPRQQGHPPHCRPPLNPTPLQVQYVALRNINLIVQKRPSLLSHEVKVFFCKYNDPLYVKMEKLEVMIRLASEANIDQVGRAWGLHVLGGGWLGTMQPWGLAGVLCWVFPGPAPRSGRFQSSSRRGRRLAVNNAGALTPYRRCCSS